MDGERDMRGADGFVSLQEALELEGTSLEEFAANIPAELTSDRQQLAAAERAATSVGAQLC